MRWFAVAGSQENPSRRVELDVHSAVTDVVKSKNAIVSSGGLGVNYLATEAAMAAVDRRQRLRVIIPTPLEIYANHYRQQAAEGVIADQQAEMLVDQLERAKALGRAVLLEMDYQTVDQTSCHARNQAVIYLADHLLAFHINQSPDTQDAIDKARQKPIPVTLKEYRVE